MEQDTQKECSICGRLLLVSLFTSNGRRGYRPECNECRSEKRRKSYAENRDQALQRDKQWKKENPEKVKKYKNKYREAHREEIKVKAKEYYEKNKVTISENQKVKYAEDPEPFKARVKHWRHKDKANMVAVDGRHKSKQRGLGYTQLNDWFEGSEFHHIDQVRGVYIPRELHRSFYHSLKTGKGMLEMNKLAFEFLNTSHRMYPASHNKGHF